MARKKSTSQHSPLDNPSNLSTNNQEALKEFQHRLERMPPEDQKRILQSFSISSFQMFSGPLPSPESLEQYNKIIPDGADRIMKMAENQSNHRIQIETSVIEGQVKQSGRGQIFALILSFLCLGSSFILAMYGHEVVASVIGGTTIISITSIFLIGKKEQKSHLAEKNKPNNPEPPSK